MSNPGTHHSAPLIGRAGRWLLSCTRVHSQRTRNSPCSQVSRKRLVDITRSVRPVSGLRSAVMAVRQLSCSTPGVVCLFMAEILPVRSNAGYSNVGAKLL